MKLVEGRVEIFFYVWYHSICYVWQWSMYIVVCIVLLLWYKMYQIGAFDIMLETVHVWFCHENVKNESQIYLFLFYKVFSVIMIGVTIDTRT